jgi:hypothetical protein
MPKIRLYKIVFPMGVKSGFSEGRTYIAKSQDNPISILTRLYGLDDWGVIPSRGSFSLPLNPDHLWGPPSLIMNGYQGLFTSSAKLKNAKPYLHSPIYVQDMVLN